MPRRARRPSIAVAHATSSRTLRSASAGGSPNAGSRRSRARISAWPTTFLHRSSSKSRALRNDSNAPPDASMTTPPPSTRADDLPCIAVASMTIDTATSAPRPTASATCSVSRVISAASKLMSSNVSGETVTLATIEAPALLRAHARERLVGGLGGHVGDLVDLGLGEAGEFTEAASELDRALVLVRSDAAEREQL